MENHEDIFDALTGFGRSSNHREIPPVLEQYLNCVAKNGETLFPWTHLKPLIVGKMEQVILDLKQGLASESIPSCPNVENVRFDVMHSRIIDALHRFSGAPFTIQRLCELLTDPRKHYKRSDKFLRGLEKNVLVVSTVDPYGRKVVSESSSKPLVNGMDMNGAFPPRDTALTVPLPPVPGWVTTSSVAAATRGQTASPLSASSDQHFGHHQAPTQDSNSASVANGVSSSLVSSVYSDQGEQLSVQSEEVVEETVVTMETSEVSSVATDGGEGMAEDEEEENLAEDRDTSSSSSSSSEELSASSDTADVSTRVPSFGVTVSSSSETSNESRAWAAITTGLNSPTGGGGGGGEAQFEEGGVRSENIALTNRLSDTSPSEATPSSPSPADSNLSSNSSPPLSSHTDERTQSDSITTSPTTTTQSASLPQSPPTSSSSPPTNEITSTPKDSLADGITTSPGLAHMQETPTPTATDTLDRSQYSDASAYTQVLASSSTDNIPAEDATSDVCDSVAGLERLVGSVDPSPMVSSSSSSSLIANQDQPCLPSSDSRQDVSVSDSCQEAEPLSKRMRLSPLADAESESLPVSSGSCDTMTAAAADSGAASVASPEAGSPADSSEDVSLAKSNVEDVGGDSEGHDSHPEEGRETDSIQSASSVSGDACVLSSSSDVESREVSMEESAATCCTSSVADGASGGDSCSSGVESTSGGDGRVDQPEGRQHEGSGDDGPEDGQHEPQDGEVQVQNRQDKPEDAPEDRKDDTSEERKDDASADRKDDTSEERKDDTPEDRKDEASDGQAKEQEDRKDDAPEDSKDNTPEGQASKDNTPEGQAKEPGDNQWREEEPMEQGGEAEDGDV